MIARPEVDSPRTFVENLEFRTLAISRREKGGRKGREKRKQRRKSMRVVHSPTGRRVRGSRAVSKVLSVAKRHTAAS